MKKINIRITKINPVGFIKDIPTKDLNENNIHLYGNTKICDFCKGFLNHNPFSYQNNNAMDYMPELIEKDNFVGHKECYDLSIIKH